MDIGKLKPAGYNPRTITDNQLENLKKALYEYGDLSGIVFNRQTGNLIGGHQRIKCLPEDTKIKSRDLKKPSRTGTVAAGTITIDGENYAYREVDWPLEREKAANIAANKHGGEFDDTLLAPILKELSEIDTFDISLTGYEGPELSGLIASLSDNPPDTPPEPREKSQVRDIYILDDNRIIVGEVVELEDVKTLIENKEPIMFYTDPDHCNKILKRWEKLTGKKAKRIPA